eukprot:jgi/Bigna1/136852/aug1.36_g11560
MLAGHPFDTVKVYLQNNRKKAIPGLYRGCVYPVATDAVYCGFVIPFYTRSREQRPYTPPVCTGFLSGVLVSPIVFALDTFKVLRQTGQRVRGDLAIALLRGRGKRATVCREALALSIYMPLYDELSGARWKMDAYNAGAVTGLLSWTLTYPIDVVRNRQMAQGIGFNTAVSQGCLWSGYSVCALRAIIVNAVLFQTREWVLNGLS